MESRDLRSRGGRNLSAIISIIGSSVLEGLDGSRQAGSFAQRESRCKRCWPAALSRGSNRLVVHNRISVGARPHPQIAPVRVSEGRNF